MYFSNSYVNVYFIYNIYDIFYYFIYMTLVLLDALADMHFSLFQFLKLRRSIEYACIL